MTRKKEQKEKARKIQAHSGHIYYQSASHVFRNASGTNTAQVDGSGNFVALANITAYGSPSDIKLKQNIEVIDNALDKVSELRGVYYNKKDSDDDKRQVGVIAQEVKEVLPEVVTYDKENDKYGVDYGKINGLLIEAIKDLKKEVEFLKKQLNK